MSTLLMDIRQELSHGHVESRTTEEELMDVTARQ